MADAAEKEFATSDVLSTVTVREKNLSTYSIFDWDRYLPEEQLLLKDAVECAQRARQRLSGARAFSRCNGRDHYA